MPPSDVAVTLREVSRRYGHRPILREVSLDIVFGEVLLLMGKNGAGKTTLLRLIAGLTRPNSGTIERFGSVGMVAHHSMLYDALTASQNLAFFARLHGLPSGRVVAAALERVGLTAVHDQAIATFSRGMLQRLAIARALLPEPEILLLDEPLSGLDDTGTTMVIDMLKALRDRGCAVVIASHQITELLPVGTRVGYLVRGRLDTPEALANRSPTEVLDHYRAAVARER